MQVLLAFGTRLHFLRLCESFPRRGLHTKWTSALQVPAATIETGTLLLPCAYNRFVKALSDRGER